MSLLPLRPLLLLLPLAAAAVAASDAQAQAGGIGGVQVPRAPMREQRQGHDRGEDHRALSDAVRRVERRTGGQVLSAERVPFDGRNVNRVKVVDASGRVRVYMDDPHNGDRRPEPAHSED